MVWTYHWNGQHQNSLSDNTVGTERPQEKTGRKRKNSVDVSKRDLKNIDFTWNEAEVLANDKAEWRRRVAQCSLLDAG